MSLRTRVLAGLAVVAVVLVGAAAWITHSTERHLVAQVDTQLASAAGPFQGGAAPTGPLLAPPAETGTAPERRSELYVGVLRGDGTVRTIFAPNLEGDAPLPDIDPQEAAAAAVSHQVFTTSAVSGSLDYRVRAFVDDRTGDVLVLALPLGDVADAVDRLVVVEAGATAVALGVLALVAWWVVRLGVRPIKRTAEAATAIAAGDLSRRVPEGDPRTEAGELGHALNAMLGEIEAAFAERAAVEGRLRQFVADASHELRTPVTTIRGYAELYRRGGLGDPGALDDAMRRSEQEAVRMAGLVDDMLELARLDRGRPLDRCPVDLDQLAHDAAQDARAVDPGRRIDLECEVAVVAEGDADRLRQVTANLVANALVHSDPDAAVTIRTTATPSEAILEVSDTGPGMDPGVAARVFERFYRADPSRSRGRGGSGLGLAIVKSVVAAHGGAIELETELGVGTTVRVRLPRAMVPNDATILSELPVAAPAALIGGPQAREA